MRSLLAAGFLLLARADDPFELLNSGETLLGASTNPAQAVWGTAQAQEGQNEDPDATTVSNPYVRMGAEVHGKNGRITVFSKLKGARDDPNKVGLVVVGVTEVNLLGVPVGFVAPDRHYQVFGQWKFNATEQQDNVTLGTMFDAPAASASQVTLTSPAGATGQLEVDVNIVSANGTAGDFNVNVGDIVFNVTLSKWSWCVQGGVMCKAPFGLLPSAQVGSYIDVVLAFKGRRGEKVDNHLVDGNCFTNHSRPNCNRFDLGGGVSLDMTNKVLLDGKIAMMPTSFPFAVTAAIGNPMNFPQVFTIRLPMFSDTASYTGVIRGSTSESAPWQAPPRGPLGEIYHKLANTATKLYGLGGKLRTFAKIAGEFDRYAVDVALVKVAELDANFKEVGTMLAAGTHSVASFLDKAFSISTTRDVSLGGTATARNTSISVRLGNGGVVRLEALVITKAGSVGPPEQQWNASVGDLKFNVALENWHWCGESLGYLCKPSLLSSSEVGAYIDVYFEVKGSLDIPLPGNSNSTFHVGGGVQLQLTRYATIDGNASAMMPEGFPNSTMLDGKHVFVLRFPRFQRSVVFDPLITSGSSDTVQGKGPATTTITTTVTTAPNFTTTYTTTATTTVTTQAAVLVNSASGISKVGGILAAALVASSLL